MPVPSSASIRFCAPGPAHLVAGRAHGRERRVDELGEVEVVEPRRPRRRRARAAATAQLLQHAEREQVVAAHDRRRRVVETQQLIDERRPELGAPGALEALEAGVDLDARGAQRIAVPQAPLLDHRPRHAAPRRTRCGGGRVESRCSARRRAPSRSAAVSDVMFGASSTLLEHDGRAPSSTTRCAYQRRSAGSPERNRNAPSARCSSSGVRSASERLVGAARLDQHAVAPIARDVADAGDHRGRSSGRPGSARPGRARGTRACACAPSAGRARPSWGDSRARVIAEDDPLARLLGHEVRAAVDEVRDGLRRDARASSDIAHRRPLWSAGPHAARSPRATLYLIAKARQYRQPRERRCRRRRARCRWTERSRS